MTTKNKVRGAVIYARVSTNEQAEHGTSMEGQIAACRAKALALNLPIVAECEDPGVSGSDYQTRPGIMEALRLVESGAASVLLATKIDRIGRSARVVLDIAERVEMAGGEVVTGDGNFDNTPGGRFLRTIYAGMAEMERDAIRERTMGGKHRRAQSGQQPSRSLSPYGYHIPTKADVLHGRFALEQVGQYVVREEQAAVVRRIFTDYAGGTHSMRNLCMELNAEGVPTPRGAAAWRPASIKAVLANPVHKGEPQYGKISHHREESKRTRINPLTGRPYQSMMMRRKANPEDVLTLAAPAIVSAEVWERAQERSAHNKATRGGVPARAQMLTGLAACPVCGGGMRYEFVKRTWRYYQCHAHMDAMQHGEPSPCDKTNYLVDTAEAAVLACLLNVAECPDAIKGQLANYARSQGQDVGDTRREMAAVDKALHTVKEQEAAAVTAQIAGIMAGASPDAYAEAFASLAARRKDLEDRRGQLRRAMDARPAPPKVQGEADTVRQALADVRRVLLSEDVPGHVKRDALCLLLQKVMPRKDGAEIVFLPHVLAGLVPDTVQGVDVPYPPGNRRLFETIAAGRGAVVSEFPMGTKPEPWRFPARNRLISGSSLGVLVLESPADSGALITAREAADQGRDVFAVPGSVVSGLNAGGHKLIQDGAKLVETVDDILNELGVLRLRSPEPVTENTPAPVVKPVAVAAKPLPSLPPEQKRVLELLTLQARPADTVIAESGLPAAQVIGILTLLEIAGLVRRLPGNTFVRVL